MNPKINILVTLDENYIPRLNVMLCSLLWSNPGASFDVYLLQSSVKRRALEMTERILGERGRLILVKAEEERLAGAPTTSRYPKEIYYRIFAARYLPQNLDRVLYLDPDLIVNGDVSELYGMDMGKSFFAAASHVTGLLLQRVNEIRLDTEENSPYINSGVMLMNLERLRSEQDFGEVFDFIEKHKKTLVLPDQDIISGLYGPRIISLNPYYYNMTERLFMAHLFDTEKFTADWVRENSVIIHYCGRNKPWKNNYFGSLDVFYKETEERIKKEYGIDI